MSKAIKYYYDLMSQPSRALWIGLKLSKTPFEDCQVAMRKRENLSEEYKKINRFQKIPAIVDGDFHLSESIAILRYLAGKGQFSESLYAKDVKQRARIDEFLEWHHLGLRYGCCQFFLHQWLLPMRGLAHVPSEEKTKSLEKEMETTLNDLENLWLPNSKFLAGDQLTVADLFGTAEVEQLRLIKYDVSKKYDKVAQWLEHVREASNPYYDESLKFIYKISGTGPKN